MATPNIVPRADREGGLGTSAKAWGKLFIEQGASGGTPAASITNLDADEVALDINASNTTANILDIFSTTLTEAAGLQVYYAGGAKSMGNGRGVINLDVVDSGATNEIHSSTIDYNRTTNTTGSKTTRASYIDISDTASGNTGTLSHTGQYINISTINNGGANDNSDITQMGIVNKIALGTVANNVGLYQNIADGGMDVKFVSSADTGDYFSIATGAAGATTITTVDDDATAANLTFTIDGAINFNAAAGTVFNEDSADVDFRIESNDETHMFFLDGGNNRVSIGNSADAPEATLEVSNHASAGATGVPLMALINSDVDQIALQIKTENTTANIIDIDAESLTTGSAIYIDANEYENGSGIIHVDFDDAQTTTLNRGKQGIIHVDYVKNVATASGQTMNIIGITSIMDDNATNVGTHTMTAFYGSCDYASTGGAVEGIGMELVVTDADVNTGIKMEVEDGISNYDLKMLSSANAGDYAYIQVGAEGATTIGTFDVDTAVAHLKFLVDGDILMDSITGITKFYKNPNVADFLQLTIGTNGDAKFVTTDAAGNDAHIELEADGNIVLDAAGSITFERGGNSASMPESNGKVVVQTTELKVMPHHFVGNGDSGRSVFVADQQTNKLGIHQFDTSDELYAHVEIPFGHTVTEVHVYCSDTITNGVTVGAYNYQTGADNAVTTTTGNTNADIALSSNTIAGGGTQDLWIKVELGAADKYLWGAKVTLAVT